MEEPYSAQMDKLARYARAMGNAKRILILRYLVSKGPLYFCDIHKILPIAKATVSQHLAELKNAGLVVAEEQPPKVKYSIDCEAWCEAKRLMTRFWNEEDNCGCFSFEK